MLNIPIIRQGCIYYSQDTYPVIDSQTNKTLAMVSSANSGLLRSDIIKQNQLNRFDQTIDFDHYLKIFKRAGHIFQNDPLFFGNEEVSIEDFLDLSMRSSGMPKSILRVYIDRLSGVMSNIDKTWLSLSRTSSFKQFKELLDARHGAFSFQLTNSLLGAILPSNSPGVHSVWIPALGLGSSVFMKPGSNEVFFVTRILQSLLKAGLNPKQVGFYPGGHSLVPELLSRCHAGILFGNEQVINKYKTSVNLQRHGPGFSKVVIDEVPDSIKSFQLDSIVKGICKNGGRSCLNTSLIAVKGSVSKKTSSELVNKLNMITPKNLEDPEAILCSFTNPESAKVIDDKINKLLQIDGAIDLTAMERKEKSRLQIYDGRTYMLPTLIQCDDYSHPIAKMELPFPFCVIVPYNDDSDLEELFTNTLVASVITQNEQIKKLAACMVKRLNLGFISTTDIDYHLPHEGNLFELLYKRVDTKTEKI